jgi:hypothetical protein
MTAPASSCVGSSLLLRFNDSTCCCRRAGEYGVGEQESMGCEVYACMVYEVYECMVYECMGYEA